MNVKVGLGSEYAVLIFGLVWTALDLLLTVRWVRIEQLVFGWTCYKRRLSEHVYRAVKMGRRMFRDFITPVFRWLVSLTASMTYVAVVKTAVDMLTCRRSKSIGGAWALGKNPTVRCFDAVHTPCFILALLAVFTVGVVWPLAWFVVLCHHFAIRNPLVKCGWSLCMRVCDKVEGERNRFEDDADEQVDDEGSRWTRSEITDQLLEFGLPVKRGFAPSLVASRIRAKGSTSKSYNAFLQTPFKCVFCRSSSSLSFCVKHCPLNPSPLLMHVARCPPPALTSLRSHLFWLILLDKFTMLTLAIFKALLVHREPTIWRAVTLFVVSNVLLIVHTIGTLIWCPYLPAARWHIFRIVAVFGFTVLSSTTNLLIALNALGHDGAYEAAQALAIVMSVALPIYLVTILIAFLFSRSLGVCKKLGCKCACLRLFLANSYDEDKVVNKERVRVDAGDELPVDWRESGGVCDGPVFIPQVVNARDWDSRAAAAAGSEHGGIIAASSTQVEMCVVAGVRVEMSVTENPFAAARVRRREAKDKAAAVAAALADAEKRMTRQRAALKAATTALHVARAALVLADDCAMSAIASAGKCAELALLPPLPPCWESDERDDAADEGSPNDSNEGGDSDDDNSDDEREHAEAPLPPGWVRHVHNQGGEDDIDDEASSSSETEHYYFFYHTATETSIWNVPTEKDVANAIAKEEAAACRLAEESSDGSGVEEAEDDAATDDAFFSQQQDVSTLELHLRAEERQRLADAARTRQARRVWTPRPDASLGSVLLASCSSADGRSASTMIPPFMLEVMLEIFADADTDGDGSLSTIELMRVLKKRAKHTGLNGDAHAMLSLKMLLTQQASRSRRSESADLQLSSAAIDEDEHEEIGPDEFARGLVIAIEKNPNGRVAQWIVKELKDAGAKWKTNVSIERKGEKEEEVVIYTHRSHGSTRTKPVLLFELERCAAALSGESQQRQLKTKKPKRGGVASAFRMEL